jgi:cytochrome bd-type quinol oxidase subunit 2
VLQPRGRCKSHQLFSDRTQTNTPLQLRARKTAHTSSTLLAPLIGLAGALVAVVFYYAVNASDVSDSFLSWTCRWRDVPMSQAPHWGTLCQQGHAGLYLAILLIPVEVVALALAVFQMKVERYTDRYLGARKTPVLS